MGLCQTANAEKYLKALWNFLKISYVNGRALTSLIVPKTYTINELYYRPAVGQYENRLRIPINAV